MRSLTQAEEIAIFKLHSLPGMALVLNPEGAEKIRNIKPAPLVKRCQKCSQPVSKTRKYCKKHADEERAILKAKVAERINALPAEARLEVISGLPEELRPDPPEGTEYRFDIFTNRVILVPKLIVVSH